MHAMATCQGRSPVRSEWRAHRTMATTEKMGGIALSSPVVNGPTPN